MAAEPSRASVLFGTEEPVPETWLGQLAAPFRRTPF